MPQVAAAETSSGVRFVVVDMYKLEHRHHFVHQPILGFMPCTTGLNLHP